MAFLKIFRSVSRLFKEKIAFLTQMYEQIER